MRGRWWTTKGPSKTSSKVPEISTSAVNVNGINRSVKRNLLSTMRREHDWGILLLSDTRVHDDREFANIDRTFGAKASVWSLGIPNGGGTSIMFFKSVLILAKYVDPEAALLTR